MEKPISGVSIPSPWHSVRRSPCRHAPRPRPWCAGTAARRLLEGMVERGLQRGMGRLHQVRPGDFGLQRRRFRDPERVDVALENVWLLRPVPQHAAEPLMMDGMAAEHSGHGASTVRAVRSIWNLSSRRKRRRPSRSMVSENTVCGSSPETNVLEQTLCATTPVATRKARSGRQITHAAVSTVSNRPAAIHFSQRKRFSRAQSNCRSVLARGLPRQPRAAPAP